jgi:NAD dependent epimerase/dehydratase family enzyme
MLDREELRGAYNAVAPEPVRNAELADALAAALGTKARFPVPGIALRLALGEGRAMLLASQRVLPRKLLAEGFRFEYPRISEALRASL